MGSTAVVCGAVRVQREREETSFGGPFLEGLMNIISVYVGLIQPTPANWIKVSQNLQGDPADDP